MTSLSRGLPYQPIVNKIMRLILQFYLSLNQMSLQVFSRVDKLNEN